MPELTQRQEMVLDFIRDFIAARGMAPTVREIMDQFHWSSPTGVVCHLKALKKKGQITWTQGLARSIQLTEKSRGIPVVNLEDVDRG